MIPLKLKSSVQSARYWFGAVFCLLVFFSSGRVTTVDVGIRAEVSRAIWKKQSLFISRDSAFGKDLVYPKSRQSGTSFYGIGQTVVFVPFDMVSGVIESLVKLIGFEGKSFSHLLRYAGLIFLYAPLLGAIAWWLLSEILIQYGIHESQARPYAFLALFTTIWLPYNSQTLQEEALVGTLFLSALLFFLNWKNTGSKIFFQLGMFLAFSTLLIRLNSVFGIALCLALVSDHLIRMKCWEKAYWRQITFSVLAILTLLMFFSYLRFGKLFSNGYEFLEGIEYRILFGPIRFDFALGLLFGLGKGLFIFSPLLLLIFVWVRRNFYSERYSVIFSALAVLASVLFHSRLGGTASPDGTESWGTRFQVHLMFLLLVPVCRMMVLYRNGAKRFLVGFLLLIGLLIQMVSMMAPDSLEYCIHFGKKMDRDAFVLQWHEGQLFQRLNSLARKVGITSSDLPGTCSKELREKIEWQYMPNLWGPVYAKKISSRFAQALILFAWFGALLLSLVFLYIATRSNRANGRVYSSPVESDLGVLPLGISDETY